MPAGPLPSAADVTIWTLRCADTSPAIVARWRELLSDAERARAERYLRVENRVESIAAHALVRYALSAQSGLPPAAFDFVPDALGKPHTHVDGRRHALAANLSHTTGMVAVAVADAETVGVDVEATGRPVNLEIADRYFCPSEVDWLKTVPEPRRREAFLRLWTGKEAFLKATGKGLTQNLQSFRISPFPIRLGFNDPALGDTREWPMRQRLLPGGFLVALCVGAARGTSLAVRWRRMRPSVLAP